MLQKNTDFLQAASETLNEISSFAS